MYMGVLSIPSVGGAGGMPPRKFLKFWYSERPSGGF